MKSNLSRRAFLKAASLGIAATAVRAADKSKKPNIIFIMADDLGYRNLGCYGQKHIQTPCLDKMCEEGMKFTRMHSGASLCLPSRVSLMTGLHTGHSRVRVNGGGGKHPPIHEEDTTLATVLKATGYKTGMTGKWSLGDDYLGCVKKHQDKDGSGALYKHGWDYYFGEPNQTYNHEYYPEQLYRYDPNGWLGEKTAPNRLVPVRYKDNRKKRTHYTHDEITKNALAFIDKMKDETFFLYVPYTIPHAKFVVPEQEPYVKDKSWSSGAKVFASMISRMDRDCGRILEKLKQHGIEKNTLVIFTSDNGGLKNFDKEFDNNGELEGYKGSLTKGGLMVPFIAWWPGTIKGETQSDYLGAFWDMMPTFAELAGIQGPDPTDGCSIVPTLTGSDQQKQHPYLYFTAGKNKGHIIRGKGEKRPDAEIHKEANTDVVVPKFKP